MSAELEPQKNQEHTKYSEIWNYACMETVVCECRQSRATQQTFDCWTYPGGFGLGLSTSGNGYRHSVNILPLKFLTDPFALTHVEMTCVAALSQWRSLQKTKSYPLSCSCISWTDFCIETWAIIWLRVAVQTYLQSLWHCPVLSCSNVLVGWPALISHLAK